MTRTAASHAPAPDQARPSSDESLVADAARGDQGAMAAIYERYHQDLYRFCMAIVRNTQDAQDALQNAMVKVLRALPGETRRIQLKPWLYRIAHNEAIELLRRRRDSVQIEPELTAAGAELADTAATRERLRRLLGDVGELPERQRAALVMRELSGLGFAEIGAAFDTSEAVARQTVYEARLSLRQMEAGREMTCERVTRELSEADGRVSRRREIQAHLRACPECRAFRDGIEGRRHDFAAIAPLPVAVSAALLKGLLGAGVASAATGAGAGAGATAAGTGAAANGAGAAGVAAGGTGAAGTGAATAGGAAAGTGAAAGVGGGAAGGAAVAGAGGVAGTATVAGAGSALAGSVVLKAAATVAVVAAGVTAADRGGLIETPLPSSIGGAKSSGPQPGKAGAPAPDRGEKARQGRRAVERARRRRAQAKRKARRRARRRAARAEARALGAAPAAQAEAGGPPETAGAGQAGPGRSRGESKSGAHRGGSKGRGRSKAHRPPRKSHPPRSAKSGGASAPKSSAKPKQSSPPPAPEEEASPSGGGGGAGASASGAAAAGS